MSWFKQIENTLFLSLVLLLGYLAYSLLLKTWLKSKVVNRVLLRDLENPYRVVGRQKFNFRIDQAMEVNFQILNNEENLIHTVANKVFEAGDHELEFDCSDLEAGWYWFQMTVPQQCITRKFKVVDA